MRSMSFQVAQRRPQTVGQGLELVGREIARVHPARVGSRIGASSDRRKGAGNSPSRQPIMILYAKAGSPSETTMRQTSSAEIQTIVWTLITISLVLGTAGMWYSLGSGSQG